MLPGIAKIASLFFCSNSSWPLADREDIYNALLRENLHRRFDDCDEGQMFTLCYDWVNSYNKDNIKYPKEKLVGRLLH